MRLTRRVPIEKVVISIITITALCLIGTWFYSPTSIIKLFVSPSTFEQENTGGWGAGTAMNDTSPLPLQIGDHHYVIQRNYVEFYHRDQSIQDVVMLEIYYPNFVPVTHGVPLKLTDRNVGEHIIRIGLVSETSYLPSIDTFLQKTQSSRHFILKEDSYDLSEMVFDIKNPDAGKEYIGAVDGSRIYIRCSDFQITQLLSYCNYKVPFDDLTLDINFAQMYLPQWKDIHHRTLQLLNGFKQD